MTNINGVKVLLLHNLKNKNEKNQKVLTTYMNYLVNSQRFEVRPPLGKFTSWRHLEDVPKNTLTFSGRPCMVLYAKGCTGMSTRSAQDDNLTIVIKWLFIEFFQFFLIPVYKTWYVLFLSYYCPGRLDQNKTIRGRPQDVGYAKDTFMSFLHFLWFYWINICGCLLHVLFHPEILL